ncbi:PREDICTED: uncharacterized protein LOC104744141 [Camelina sativa]|uniref:Uncharacterized protein LOC104744141 n=1 Tax=Camelina sativa TaxID=90675 RepID=A0ABM0VZ63_CAMSA|nr:PREDICTED: uncharacterized protein LOC104744141 [Camelina sativa]
MSGQQVTVAADASSTKIYSLNAYDNPCALISSVILTEDNYPEWATELKNSLQAKQKLGFIDGTVLKPAVEPDLSMWLNANSMIVGRIRTSIDPKICSTVSKQVWKDEISACRQDGQSVLSYYGRLSKLLEELQNYNTSWVCCCAAAPDIAKDCEDDKVHQFLFGLDLPRFTNIRSTITNQDPLPSLNQVYFRVVREEKNLNDATVREVNKTEGIGFSVQPEVASQVAVVFGSRTRDRSTLSCTHCRCQVHDVSECFQLHGFPDWYFEQKGGTRSSTSDTRDVSVRGSSELRSAQRGGRSSRGRGRGRGRVNNARAATVSDSNTDQITHLISLLQSQCPSTTSEKLSGKTDLTDVIIDTGASHHMTGDCSLLVYVVDIVPSSVMFSDGRLSRATKCGSLRLSPAYLLNHVLVVPDFDCTLIFVSKLLKQTGSIAIFTDTLCFLQDRFSRILIGAGEEREGVYYFTGVSAACVNKVSSDVSASPALWHRRLGHPSTSVLLSLPECVQSPNDYIVMYGVLIVLHQQVEFAIFLH